MTAASGRIGGNGRNDTSSRASRGHRPARRKEDFPEPEEPSTTRIFSTPLSIRPRMRSRPRTIRASRPKKIAASCGSSARRPGKGARCGSLGGGHGKLCALEARALQTTPEKLEPGLAEGHLLLCPTDVDLEGAEAILADELAELPLRRHLGGQALDRHRLDHQSEDAFAVRNRMENRCLQRSGYPNAQPSREPVYIAIAIGIAVDDVAQKRSYRGFACLPAPQVPLPLRN
jgi:hypothetical protein